jgi:hypothetical protein
MRRFIASISTTSSVLAEDGTPRCYPASDEVPTTLSAINAQQTDPISSAKAPDKRAMSWCDTVAAAQQVANNAPVVKPILNLSTKERQWLQLLRDRPEQDAMLPNWMDTVISISEEPRSGTNQASPVDMRICAEAKPEQVYGVQAP